MCTAVSLGRYFGRNLDLERSYGESVVITPRNYKFPLRTLPCLESHYAMIGMATVSGGYPLYYEATNEKGLSMAGLNFPGNADYKPYREDRKNITPFEFIPYILSLCENVDEAEKCLADINLVNISFSKELPLSPLHWIISDRKESIVIEATRSGLNICDNPTGILTNSPPFDYQLYNLNNYLNLTSKTPKNNFSEKLELNSYSNGLGAIGIPGDYSSASRFVRAVFAKYNTLNENSEQDSIRRFFEILSTVEIPKGLVKTKEGNNHFTLYSSCINSEKGIYYYKTNQNKSINAVSLFKENLNSDFLLCYPLAEEMKINYQN
jgi:choloylglycine hydrolase